MGEKRVKGQSDVNSRVYISVRSQTLDIWDITYILEIIQIVIFSYYFIQSLGSFNSNIKLLYS